MTPGARLAAAAEILSEIFARKAAADRTLAAWGRAHRFAGAKDRAAIAERVYVVLRRRNECAFAMAEETPRALVLGSLAIVDGSDTEHIDALCTDGPHAPGALTALERAQLASPRRSTDLRVALNYPEWLHDDLLAAFGDDLVREMTALNARAPLDLRVNTLKARRDDVMRELEAAGLAPEPLQHAPAGIRLAAGLDAKVTRLPAYAHGRVEIQDEASQRAVLLAEAHPGDIVIDLAAGGGGKSLALAAIMNNQGRIFACDVEPQRLRNMEPRLARAGATIVEIVGDPYGGAIVAAAEGGADLVFVDAPCSGSGTWRRNPEAKWTLDPERLSGYLAAQAKLLDRAGELAKPGGRIAYAVCSVLPVEGDGQLRAFLAREPDWRLAMQKVFTPARDGTDGFYLAVLTNGPLFLTGKAV
jgi:16S rRNA (cytosine967-C5)-methyltransferase